MSDEWDGVEFYMTDGNWCVRLIGRENGWTDWELWEGDRKIHDNHSWGSDEFISFSYVRGRGEALAQAKEAKEFFLDRRLREAEGEWVSLDD